MKRAFAIMAALTVGTVSLALADVQESVADAPSNPLETPWSRPQATYRIIDPGLTGYTGDDSVAAVSSNVIYLNNCKPNGCQITPGNENSTTNRSTIPNQVSTVQPYAYSDANWQEVVACVKNTYAPFGVQIVTERPATGGYHMAIVAGRPGDVGMQNGVGGVSPFTCGYIPNAISFSVRERLRWRRRRHLLDRRAGDRALVGPRPQVRQQRSDDLPAERSVAEGLPERRRPVRRVQRTQLPVRGQHDEQLPDDHVDVRLEHADPADGGDLRRPRTATRSRPGSRSAPRSPTTSRSRRRSCGSMAC